jgi:hypothetical protein
VRGVGLDDPPLAGGRALPRRPPAAKPIPGQRGLWRIPTQDLLAAGLRPGQAHGPDREQKNEPTSRRRGGQPADDRVRELEHALELERIRRRAAEDLAAERAHTIQSLEGAPGGAASAVRWPSPQLRPPRPLPGTPSEATYTAGPAPQPGMLPMVRKRRPAKRELSQEEKAAIIGRALSGQRPPKRRWL